eukprot:Em0180g3a
MLADIVPDLLLQDISVKYLLNISELDYKEEENLVLGTGGFGKVYRGRCHGKSVAIKRYLKGDEALSELRKEAMILQQFHHPCLVCLVGVCVHPIMAMVLEEAPMGSLESPLIKARLPIHRLVIHRIAIQVAAALNFLHEGGIIFRDLKAANVLLWSLDPESLCHCKVTDFGIATNLTPIGARGIIGTKGFIAPEVLHVGKKREHSLYDHRADIFSFGMFLYQMIYRRHPFHDMLPVRIDSAVENGERPRLMQCCWQADPRSRPATAEIIDKLCLSSFQSLMSKKYFLKLALVIVKVATLIAVQLAVGERHSDISPRPLIYWSKPIDVSEEVHGKETGFERKYLTQSQKQKLENLIWEFRSLFVTEGGPTGRTSKVKYAIITNGLPVREPIRRIPHALQETVKLEVKKMLKDGVIRESNSPCMVITNCNDQEKNGSWRFCVDFRKVNSMTQKEAYPLPRIDETLEALTGSQFFTTLDLASGYWQVEMEEADRKKTAFSTREGHFEFNVMPFGLTNAPATFQRLVECVLAVPSDIKELRQFLGLTNYYRRFIKGYSSIAEPLHKLTRKTEGGFKWNSECQNAFQHLKHLLVSPPILAYPQFQLPFVVTLDASSCAIGAVLSQEHEGEEKVIAYWSRQLSKAEQNYSTIEREALAVVAAVKEFFPYLYGKSFNLLTDHNPLTSLRGLKDTGGRITRWLLFLQQVDIAIKYRAGKSNGGMSRRRPDEEKLPVVNDGVFVNGITCSGGQVRLKREQAADEFTSKIVRAIENGMSPPDEKWSKLDGVLCRHAKSVKNPKTLTVIPKSLRALVFELLHSKSGHLGVHKTLEKIKEHFFWPGYEQDIREAVKKCEACQRRNTPVPVPQAPLSEYPFQRLSWDIMGPLPATSCGNNDQGANFVSEVMQSLCAQLGIKRTQTSAYHPEGNGPVECFNRTLEAMLSKVVEEHQKDWDCHLQKVLFAFRTAVHESTGYTPLFVMSGRSPNLPIDVLLVELKLKVKNFLIILKPCHSDPEPESDAEIKNPEPSSSKQVTPEDNNTHMEVVQDMTLPEVLEDETVIPVEDTILENEDHVILPAPLANNPTRDPNWKKIVEPVKDSKLSRPDLQGSKLTTEEKNSCMKEFSELFDDGELGRTSKIRHAITTFGPPIRQPIHRFPVALKKTVQEEVQKMLKNKPHGDHNTLYPVHKTDSKNWRPIHSEANRDVFMTLTAMVIEMFGSKSGDTIFPTGRVLCKTCHSSVQSIPKLEKKLLDLNQQIREQLRHAGLPNA